MCYAQGICQIALMIPGCRRWWSWLELKKTLPFNRHHKVWVLLFVCLFVCVSSYLYSIIDSSNTSCEEIDDDIFAKLFLTFQATCCSLSTAMPWTTQLQFSHGNCGSGTWERTSEETKKYQRGKLKACIFRFQKTLLDLDFLG